MYLSTRSLTMKILILSLLFLTAMTMPADAQVTCFTYPSGMVSCDSPSGNTIQQDFGNSQGVILGPRGEVTPYAIIPPPSTQPPRASERPYLHEQQRPSNYFDPYRGDSGSDRSSSAPIFVPYNFGDSGR
jgi:hypothetical protein